MVKIEQSLSVDFSDVLIRPKRSSLSSRYDVELRRTFIFTGSNRRKNIRWEGVPVMSANMDTTGTLDVYETLRKNKMITIFHKFYKNADFVQYLKDNHETRFDGQYCGVSTGIFSGFKSFIGLSKNSESCKITDYHIAQIKQFENCKKEFDDILSTVEPYFICIDVANGYSQLFVEFCSYISKNYPQYVIIAGNVATREITEELIMNCGVDIVKVGIGPGSACTTRLKTGVGVPQLTAIMECADAAHGVGGFIIGDGGITCPGDMAKAFCGGADFVMVGGQFAGHDQNPGEIIEKHGEKYKLFYGMSSFYAQEKNYKRLETYRTSEGRVVEIPYKGDLQNTLNDYMGGLRSACTYIGAETLNHLSKCATFIMVHNQLNCHFQGKDK